MGNFARVETDTFPLKHGETITVKRELSAGEDRARLARMSRDEAGTLALNRLEVGRASILAYLVDWTLTDDHGQVVPIRGIATDDLARTLDSLRPDRYKEILKLIEAHEATQEGAFDPFSRQRILSDLNICRAMHWSYADLEAIPKRVYDVLVEELVKEADLQSTTA